jgi:uncharacterized protein (TIGR02217 family)
VIGVGDGATVGFPLVKSYISGPARYDRPIAKPVAGTVRVSVDGVELTAGESFVVDATTGLVTLESAPAPGATVAAGFAFDTPVRFDTDRLELDLAAFEAGAAPSIPVVEVRLP